MQVVQEWLRESEVLANVLIIQDSRRYFLWTTFLLAGKCKSAWGSFQARLLCSSWSYESASEFHVLMRYYCIVRRHHCVSIETGDSISKELFLTNVNLNLWGPYVSVWSMHANQMWDEPVRNSLSHSCKALAFIENFQLPRHAEFLYCLIP